MFSGRQRTNVREWNYEGRFKETKTGKIFKMNCHHVTQKPKSSLGCCMQAFLSMDQDNQCHYESLQILNTF